MKRKFTYVLNHFSPNESSHFLHIIRLLDIISRGGCEVCLIIEKAEGLPVFESRSVSVEVLRSKNRLVRFAELILLISRQIRRGYMVTFVRIAAPAAIAAAICHKVLGGKSMLWQSGTTHQYDRARPLSFAKLRWWFTSFLPNKFARFLTREFVTGPEAMVAYYADVVGVPRKKIRLLYNDVDVARFSPKDYHQTKALFRADHGLPADAVVMLLVHRLSPVRRTSMYLAPVFKMLASIEVPWFFVLVGGGEDLPAARELCDEYGLSSRCLFTGDVPNRDIQEWYGLADIFVHPTHAEGFPRVIIEAMAAGLPIVTTDAGGTRQLLGEKQQKYVTDRDCPDEFSMVLAKLMRCVTDQIELGSENEENVGRFATEEVAEMYIKTIFS